MIKVILNKFNEDNTAYSKKNCTQTKVKFQKDYQFFQEKIKQENTLYTATFIDVDPEKINIQGEELNEMFSYILPNK